MRSSRNHGFTLIELVIVLVIIGILTVVTLPKIGTASRNNAVRAGARDIATFLDVARATAIQNGRLVQFRLTGDSIAVVRVNGDNSTTTVATRNLAAAHGVTVSIASSAADTLVQFDPRGMALPAVSRRYIVSRQGWSDTVCVFGAGKTAINSCALAQ